MAHRVPVRSIPTAIWVPLLLLLVAAISCQPTPAPTAAPAKPAATAAEKPAEKPAVAPTTAPAAPPTVAPTTAVAPKPTAAAPPKPAAQTGRLVVAVGQWGIETPFAWRTSQSEKNLWDLMYDPLIMRDPKTFEYRPGLATEWKNSPDYKVWTFKLRQGVMFHETWGEMTSEDVKFTVEQNLKPDAQGGSAPFFKTQLDKIETPDKYTVVMYFKTPVWEVPSHFVMFNGYQNISSKKHLEAVGEEKAAQNPIGTGPYRHVEGRQGDYHRFEALPSHWRVTGEFKEIVIRRVPDPAARLAGLRAGEIDVGQVSGDYLDQAKRAGLRIHEVPNAAPYWVILPGQVTPDKPDYCPQCPWVGEPDAKSQENAKKVRLAMNLAVDKKAIIDGLWKGYGSQTPFSFVYFPFNKGYSADWKIEPYDPQRAKQLLAEAGVPAGYEIKVNPMVFTFANDGNDVMEAVALDWEKVGFKVKRLPEDFGNFLPKVRARKTNTTGWVYAVPPFDEPSLGWQRCCHSKGAFMLLGERWDKEIDVVLAELDPEKRAKLTHDLGQKMIEDIPSVRLGIKTLTWAVTKQVGDWPTLVSAPLENNIEYIKRAGP